MTKKYFFVTETQKMCEVSNYLIEADHENEAIAIANEQDPHEDPSPSIEYDYEVKETTMDEMNEWDMNILIMKGDE